MIIARKLSSAVRLYRSGGFSTVAELAWQQSQGYLAANAIVPRRPKQQAALLSRVFNDRAEYSFVLFNETDARACRPQLILPYVRKQFFDVSQLDLDPRLFQPAEVVIFADALVRRWEFTRLDGLLPEWRNGLAGTKFAASLEQMGRRVALRLGRLAEAARGLAAGDGDLAECRLRAEIFDAQGRMDEALKCFEQAVQRRVNDPLVRMNFAFHLLKRGQVLEGLQQWGLAECLMNNYPLRKRRRQWAGEPLGQSTLLVVFEHGLGDMIQLSRFLHPLRRAHPQARIIGSVPEPLAGLLSRSFPEVTFVSTDAESMYDFYIPSVQLPLLLDTSSLEPTADYLCLEGSPSSGASRGKNAARRRVGVCWRGHPRQYELTRSIPLQTFSRLFDAADTDFVVLLNQLTPDEKVALQGFENVQVPEIRDFTDLGALVAGCDLVISVDTAVAHVAGAGGKRALLLSRPDSCWRWGHTGTRSGWYSSITVVRHPGDMDWGFVLAEAARLMRAEFRPASSHT